MPLTQTEVDFKISTLAKNNRALMKELFERLSTIQVGPSKEVQTALFMFVVALYPKLMGGADDASLELIARLLAEVNVVT